MPEKLLTIKELAAALTGPNGKPRSRGYVHAMKKCGFPMPRRRATLRAAKAWLRRNPAFTWKSAYLRKEG